jgi:hypothetical protein
VASNRMLPVGAHKGSLSHSNSRGVKSSEIAFEDDRMRCN